MEIGYISKTESFGLVDGPGVRFVAFLQGCQMRCRYCHNPETWPQSGGTPMTSEELLKKALRYRSYWKENGGITVSGGEPLLQLDFVSELFALAKQEGVHTALDTSGNPFSEAPAYLEKFDNLMQNADLVLLDLKEMLPDAHKALTGCSNDSILSLARYLSAHQKPVWIRHVCVPGLTDSPESLHALRDFLKELKNVERVELLPYHNMAIGKWKQLGIPYTLEEADSPDPDTLLRIAQILQIPQEV